MNMIRSILLLPIKTGRALYKRLFPLAHARYSGVQFGTGCRFINVDFGSEPWLIQLGSHVSATDCNFVTHDGGVWVMRDVEPTLEWLKPIRVGDNVFFGLGAIVMPGAVVGSNVVVGAGAVVVGEVPSNCVVAGVPARFVCSIEEYRDRCLKHGTKTRHLAAVEKRRKFTELYFPGKEK